MLRPSIFTDNFADTMFDEFFHDPFWPSAPHMPHGTASLMNTDIRETDEGYQIEMELPGFAKEDVRAELKDGYLTVEASRNAVREDGGNEKYLRRERYTGQCSRSFYVGDAVTQEDIRAKFSDGILTILVPKKEEKPAVEEKKYISIGE